MRAPAILLLLLAPATAGAFTCERSLAWDLNPPHELVLRYRVERPAGQNWTREAEVDGDVTTWPIENLNCRSRAVRCWRVRAVNAWGAGPPSNTACTGVGPSQPGTLRLEE